VTSVEVAGSVEVAWSRTVPADRLSGWLSPAELHRLDGLRDPGDRDRFATARVLARLRVGARTGADPRDVVIRSACAACGGTDHGRPAVAADPVDGDARAGRPPQLSLAHAADVVAVAVSTAGPVGVDLEPVAAVFDGFDGVALGAGEARRIGASGGLDAHAVRLRAWVRKESVLKATGRGLAVDPRDVDLDDAGGRPVLRRLPGEAEPDAWALWDVDGADGGHPWVGAVAVRVAMAGGPGPTLTVVRVTADAFAAPRGQAR